MKQCPEDVETEVQFETYSFRHKRQKQARVAKESNALLQEPCIYSDRETMGVAYKMIELRHPGSVTPDMTSEVQAVELCGGPQCEACNLSQYFPCGPQDANIYEISKLRSSQGSLRTFKNTRPNLNSNSDFPPPPPSAVVNEVDQNCHQNEEDKCNILDLVPMQSQKASLPRAGNRNRSSTSKSLLNSSNAGSADVVLPQGSRHSANATNAQQQQQPKLPMDLTAPCNTTR